MPVFVWRTKIKTGCTKEKSGEYVPNQDEYISFMHVDAEGQRISPTWCLTLAQAKDLLDEGQLDQITEEGKKVAFDLTFLPDISPGKVDTVKNPL